MRAPAPATKSIGFVCILLLLAVPLAARAPPAAPTPTPQVVIVTVLVKATRPPATLSPTPQPPTATPPPTRTPRPTNTTAPTPTLEPTPVVVTGDLADLLDAGQVEMRANGRGLERLELDLRSLIEDLLEVNIPAGTYFVAETAGVQNMVVRRARTVLLAGDDWVELLLEVACANMELHEPETGHGFGMRGPSGASADLQLLAPVLEAERPGYDIEQAAIWIVTDNADYADLGILVSGFGGFGARVIGEDDAARAMQLVHRAGIDITRKAIWRDRQRIADGCTDAALAEWLRTGP